MPTLDVINQKKEKVGKIDLSDAVFGAKVNVALVHQAIKAYRANIRQGTHSTKTKREVRGGGAKPFKQKGTGNARQGSIRSPLQPGGGQTFGPKPRDYRQDFPKKMLRGALISALSDRVKSDRVLVIDDLDLKEAKTKQANQIISKNLGLSKVTVVDVGNRNLEIAGKNIPDIKIMSAATLNVYEVIRAEWLLLTQKAAQELEKRLGAEGGEKTASKTKKRASKKGE